MTFSIRVSGEIGERLVSAQKRAAMLREALSSSRPKAKSTKMSLMVRYDAEVVEAFKVTGKGWPHTDKRRPAGLAQDAFADVIFLVLSSQVSRSCCIR